MQNDGFHSLENCSKSPFHSKHFWAYSFITLDNISVISSTVTPKVITLAWWCYNLKSNQLILFRHDASKNASNEHPELETWQNVLMWGSWVLELDYSRVQNSFDWSNNTPQENSLTFKNTLEMPPEHIISCFWSERFSIDLEFTKVYKLLWKPCFRKALDQCPLNFIVQRNWMT